MRTRLTRSIAEMNHRRAHRRRGPVSSLRSATSAARGVPSQSAQSPRAAVNSNFGIDLVVANRS